MLPHQVFSCRHPCQRQGAGAAEGNRTPVTSLEGWGSAIKLQPQIAGFSPSGRAFMFATAKHPCTMAKHPVHPFAIGSRWFFCPLSPSAIDCGGIVRNSSTAFRRRLGRQSPPVQRVQLRIASAPAALGFRPCHTQTAWSNQSSASAPLGASALSA